MQILKQPSLMCKIFIVLAIINILFMIITGYSYKVNPIYHEKISALGIAFPAFLFINFVFLVIFAFFNVRYCIIPLLAFVIVYKPARLYMPINVPKSPPPTAIKVLSYNTQNFGYSPGEMPRHDKNEVVSYILKSNADIVCLQEASEWALEDSDQDSLMSKYKYGGYAVNEGSGDVVSIYSKFPTIKIETAEGLTIDFGSKVNIAMVGLFRINNKRIAIFNVHLESNNITAEDKQGFKSIVKGNVITENRLRKEGLLIFDKLALALSVRVNQRRKIMGYVNGLIKRNNIDGFIICGDFNEWPNGYNVVKFTNDFKNCFVDNGNGVGWSYNRSGMYVRIDNIFCSKKMQSYGTTVDKSIKASDHYPIYTYIDIPK